MNNSIYELQDISFIAGETQDFFLRLYDVDNYRVDTDSSTCNFSLKKYGSTLNQPLFSKMCEVKSEIIKNKSVEYFHLHLLPTETINLHGLYIYQFTIKSKRGVEVYQGMLNIQYNVNNNFAIN